MTPSSPPGLRAAGLLILLCVASASSARSEDLSRFEKNRAHMMLDILKTDLIKYYYDGTFHGIALDDTFKTADERIDRAQSLSQALGIIAVSLLGLNDSHTYFIPPERSAKFYFGWRMQAIGEACYVTSVREGSNAAAQGLKPGDRVLTVSDRELSRQNLWALYYAHRVLAPRATLPMRVQAPGEDPRLIEVTAKIEERKVVRRSDSPFDLGDAIRESQDYAYLSRHRFMDVGDRLLIWRMPQFDLTPEEVRLVMHRVRKRSSLILDLRGNYGGSIETLERMIGGFIEHKTKIGDLTSRAPFLPMLARKTGDLFEGTLVVLVDSESASAAELFARMMQIAGRARVIGDRMAGAVMVSRTFEHHVAGALFASSITVADIIMPDGKSLEHTGVVPDEVLLPGAEDIAAGRDPVLSRAAALCGAAIDPVTAGGYFPIEWKR